MVPLQWISRRGIGSFVLVALVAAIWHVYVVPEAVRWMLRCSAPRRFGDDYCDCADGRDEPFSAACGGVGDFECLAALVEPLRVRSSVVRDGLMDCCDGSDEGHFEVAACARRATTALQELELRAETATRVASARGELLDASAKAMREAELALAAAKPSFEAAYAQARDAFARERLRNAAFRLRQLEVTAARPPALFGEDGGWLGLHGSCFESEPLSEKSTLGGTSKVEPNYYVFRFCPLDNITQHVYRPKRRNSRDERTVLGVWGAWVDVERRDLNVNLLYTIAHNISLIRGDARHPTSLQLYERGQPCVGGRSRHVLVRPVCSHHNAILSVDEDGVCRYLVDFSTPLACPPDDPAERRRGAVRLGLLLKSHSAIIGYRAIRHFVLKPARARLALFTNAISSRLSRHRAAEDDMDCKS